MAIPSAFLMMGGFFLVGVYVAGALGVLSLILMYAFSDAPLWNIMGNRAWETNSNCILIAVRLFRLIRFNNLIRTFQSTTRERGKMN